MQSFLFFFFLITMILRVCLCALHVVFLQAVIFPVFFPREAMAQSSKVDKKVLAGKSVGSSIDAASGQGNLPVSQGFTRLAPALEVATTQASLRPAVGGVKLVVVMSFDQMRGDYPNRWGHLWGQQGFNRVVRQGAYFPQCYFNHASNITAPGHSVHLTGVYPAKSGIVSNDYNDRTAGRKLYCVQDTVNKTFGVSKPDEWCSPINLKVPTLGDYLKKISPKSRVVGISQKDRAAILMSGHTADAAYWFEYEAGGYTSSEYYFKELPAWLKKWNQKNSFREYSGKVWDKQIGDDVGLKDSIRWEAGGKQRNVFPYTLPNMNTTGTVDMYSSSTFTVTPYSVEHFFKFAQSVLKEEKLGADSIPDIFCLSISATDYAGHTFGPDSRELQELYLNVDKYVGEWIDYLDNEIGRKNYTLVITSDHGVAPTPEYWKYANPGADAGRLRSLDVIEDLENYLRQAFIAGSASKWIDDHEQPSLFFNQQTLEMVTTTTVASYKTPTRQMVLDSAQAFLQRYQGMGIVLTETQLQANSCPKWLSPWQYTLIRNDYFPQRTGEIVCYPAKYWVWGTVTATHGTPHDYDRHSPLILMGAGVKPGYYRDAKVAPSDIAPTLAQILGITMQNVDGTLLPWR
ncbi:MAG: alkaline phosphatase family protein [Candidatus Kapaibacterium sp.]|nr:MAG: alkaline phosphatase family protein [Candidatus Kapabacteria bacterium]